MTGDTIVVNTRLESEPRPKRLKTGQARAGDNNAMRFPIPYPLQNTRAVNGYRSSDVNVVDCQKESRELNGELDPQTSAAVRAAKAVIADAVTAESTPSPRLPKSASPEQTPPRVLRSDTKAINVSHAPDINLSSAPTDPIELTWWVAQHLTHFQNTTSLDPDLDSRRRNQTPPNRPLRRLQNVPNHDMEQRQVSERERVREDNRERKKRWRASNTERNKDNDLRCRVNKLAKSKFGVENTVEKAKFVENEFNKRRTKREAKQRKRATQSRQFPHFSLPPSIRDTLFPQQQQKRGLAPKQVVVVGNLLADLLFANDQDDESYVSKERAANAVNLALTKSTFNDSTFIEALRTIASNKVLMKGINNALESDHEEVDEEANGMTEDEEQQRRLQPAETRAEATVDDASITIEQSNEMIKALNAALALMNEMADTRAKTYASPYGNPPSLALGAKKPVTDASSAKDSSTASSYIPSIIDTEQIDALLALANGGSLLDDEDDKTIADGDELEEQMPDTSHEPGIDTDVCDTIEDVIDQLVKQRSEVEDGSTQFGLQSAEEQAKKLRQHFSQAGIRGNFVVPAAHGQTLSQLYSFLSSRTRPSSSPGKPLSGPVSTYVGPQQPPPVPPLLTLPTLTPSSQASPSPPVPPPQVQATVSFPLKAAPNPTGSRSEEEQQKIRSYGFPPLPGSRIGARNT